MFEWLVDRAQWAQRAQEIRRPGSSVLEAWPKLTDVTSTIVVIINNRFDCFQASSSSAASSRPWCPPGTRSASPARCATRSWPTSASSRTKVCWSLQWLILKRSISLVKSLGWLLVEFLLNWQTGPSLLHAFSAFLPIVVASSLELWIGNETYASN